MALVAAPLLAAVDAADAQDSTSTSRRELPGTVLEAEQRDDGGGSSAPWVIGSGVAALAVILVGGTVLQRRSDRGSGGSGGSGDAAS